MKPMTRLSALPKYRHCKTNPSAGARSRQQNAGSRNPQGNCSHWPRKKKHLADALAVSRSNTYGRRCAWHAGQAIVTQGTTADCAQAVAIIDGFTAENLLDDKGYDTDAILA